jgi:hypothetical protein
VLDVGIGTAFALCMNASEVLSKDLSVVGIDIDDHYIKGAEQNCIKCAHIPSAGTAFLHPIYFVFAGMAFRSGCCSNTKASTTTRSTTGVPTT